MTKIAPASDRRRRSSAAPTGYDVFISYSRGASAELASDLERGLERLAKRWNQLRAVRVFRDDSAMSASPALWETISAALDEADWLILIATPESAQSEYVNKELEHWLKNKSAQQILLVHAGGTIRWDDTVEGATGSGGFHEASTAIPAPLRAAYPSEPRWVDLEWYSREGSLKTSDPRFIDRLGDLAAPVRGTTKAELIGEDVRQHRRTRRLTRAAVATLSALLAITLVAGLVAIAQRSTAIEQRNLATEQSLIARTRLMAATAVDRSATDLQSSLLLSATAYRTRPEAQTSNALHRVLTTSPQLSGFYDFGTRLSIVASGPDQDSIVAGTESGKVISLNLVTGVLTELFEIGRPVTYLAQSSDGDTIVASGTASDPNAEPSKGPSSKVWTGGEVIALPQLAIAMSPSGETIALRPEDSYNDSPVAIWRDNQVIKTIQFKTAFTGLPDDDTIIGIDGYGSVLRTSIDDDRTESTQISMGLHMFGGDLSDNGKRFSFIRGGDEIEVWDFAAPLPPSYDDSDTLIARTGSVRTRSMALNGDGTKLATAADGSIFVSDVVDRGQTPEVVVLRGAGRDVSALAFTDSDTLLSIANETVAVWTLDSTNALAEYVPAELFGDCNACAPATTLPSPKGTKAIINPAGGFGTILNFDLRWSATYSEIRERNARQIFDSQPALAWLDDDRLFAYSATSGKAWILEGDFVDQVTTELPTHTATAPVNKAFLRDDGAVVMVADGKALILDPGTGASEVGNYPAEAVSADGNYTVALEGSDSPTATTNISIFSTKSSAIVYNGTIEGTVDPQLFVHDRGEFVFARTSSDRSVGSARNTELLRINPANSEVRVIGTIGPGVRYNSGAVAEGYLYAEGSGEILQISLDDASTISLLSILSAPVAPNGLGISENGQLVIESEPTQQGVRLPVSAESWIAKSCALANRPLEPSDYEFLEGSDDGIQPAC